MAIIYNICMYIYKIICSYWFMVRQEELGAAVEGLGDVASLTRTPMYVYVGCGLVGFVGGGCCGERKISVSVFVFFGVLFSSRSLVSFDKNK